MPERKRIVDIVATTVVLLVLVLCWAWSVFVFQPFGNRQWVLATLTVILGWLVMGIRWNRRLTTDPSTRVTGNRSRFASIGRWVLAPALVCWIGLIVWSALSPGGAMPPTKNDENDIRVVTWNILHGSETGMPWSRYGWPVRKNAIQIALAGTRPDILCVQEALDEQVRFLSGILPGHQRVGVGRDDGKSAGEHCAIFFDRARFDELGGGTFWLEEPSDRPATEARWGPKRICTWVRLRDRASGRTIRVYNAHQYLTESARVAAAHLILSEIDSSKDPSDAVLVAGDFNAPPDTRDRRLFEAAGLVSSTTLAALPAGQGTYQFYGIRLRRLDDILVNRVWRVLNQYVLDVKPENAFPSDHFGVLVDLVLSDPSN